MDKIHYLCRLETKSHKGNTNLETEREEEAELDGKTYKRLVSGFYRWSQWATPKKRDPQTGKMVLDTVNAMSGDDLVEFVDQKLFPYLKEFLRHLPIRLNIR